MARKVGRIKQELYLKRHARRAQKRIAKQSSADTRAFRRGRKPLRHTLPRRY